MQQTTLWRIQKVFELGWKQMLQKRTITFRSDTEHSIRDHIFSSFATGGAVNAENLSSFGAGAPHSFNTWICSPAQAPPVSGALPWRAHRNIPQDFPRPEEGPCLNHTALCHGNGSFKNVLKLRTFPG